MKWCVEFPEESILVVRPCLKHICLDISPAANLLSSLLYRYSIRKESQEDADNINALKVAKGEKADQDTSYRIYRTQAQIAKDTCYEVSEKTLHDVAIPTLQFMGYMDLEEYPGRNCYILHMDRIVAAIAAYKKGPEGLKTFFSSIPQLEKVLIAIQLEKVLINKKYFLSQLEKVLIANRNISYCKRGRKTRTGDGLDTQIPKPQISIEINKKISNNTEEESDGSIEHITSLTPEQMIAFLSANGYTVLPGNNPLIAESSVTQNTHPLCTPLLQGGANTHPSSDNMTPPTTSVAITPRFKGENTAASIQDESSTSHAATTPVENSEETHDKAPQSEIVSNGTPVTSEAAQSQNELFPDAEVSAASGAIVPEVEKVSAAKGDKPKPTRKPRAKKNVFTIPEELRERVNKVYAKFDALRQKVTSDPEERYIRNEESDRAICTLFQAKAPTEERLEKVYMAMWNEPRNQRTGYFAREHMTITTVCKKYADQSMVYSAQDNQSKGVVSFSAGGYTYKPEEMPVRELEFVGPSNRKRRGA